MKPPPPPTTTATICQAAKFCRRRISGRTTTGTNNCIPDAIVENESSSSSSTLLSNPIPNSPSPAPAHTSIATTLPPPTTTTTTLPPPPPTINTTSPSWISRFLHLWDQKSGTHEILQLKENVNISSTQFDTKQRHVAQARAALDAAMEAFEHSQLEHTRLLRNRDTWTSTQAYDFAKLIEKEIDIRKELESAKKTLVRLEAEQLTSMHEYMNHLRRRYHEEQVWQDKWRVYSTYGTWLLLVFNSMVFLIGQYMTRIRESQRMKDVQELVLRSIMANEGTLRAIQEQHQHEMQDRRQQKKEGMEERRRKDKTVTSKEEEDGIFDAAASDAPDGTPYRIATISTNEAAALVSDEGDERKEKKNNSQPVMSTISPSFKFRNLWSSTFTKSTSNIAAPREITSPSTESTTNSNKLVVATTPLSSTIQQYWSNLYKSASGIKIPRKITLTPGVCGDDGDGKSDMIEVDLPSAILGASVAGIAWIIVNIIAPSRS